MAGWDADRLVAEVRRLGRRGLPRDEYFSELGVRLRRTIPVDAACWHGLDPHTLLLTSANPVELVEHGYLSEDTLPLAARSVVASEYEREDYNSFASLARRRAPVGILSEATRGHPERSARYRDYLRRAGHRSRCGLRWSRAAARGRAWCCTARRAPATSSQPMPA